MKCLSYCTILLMYCQDKVIGSSEEEGEDADNVYGNEEQ